MKGKRFLDVYLASPSQQSSADSLGVSSSSASNASGTSPGYFSSFGFSITNRRSSFSSPSAAAAAQQQNSPLSPFGATGRASQSRSFSAAPPQDDAKKSSDLLFVQDKTALVVCQPVYENSKGASDKS